MGPRGVGAMREGRGFLASLWGGLSAQPGQRLFEVVDQQVGQIVAEAVANNDPQHGQVFSVGREGVGRYQPAALAQCRGDIEHRVAVLAVGQGECEHRQLTPVGQQPEGPEPSDAVCQAGRDSAGVLLNPAIALGAQAQEVVVLGDDLGARTGKVQREGRHLAAEVVDAEHQVLGQRLGVAPDDPSDPRI